MHKPRDGCLADLHLEALRAVLASEPGVLAAILTGSAARGELTICRDPDGAERVYSDYEFLIIARQRGARRLESDLRHILDTVVKDLPGGTPLLSADIAVRTSVGARRLPRTMWLFETRRCGATVVGDDSYRRALPEVTLANLNFGELNEILLWRMVALAKRAPTGRRLCGEEERLIRHVAARNTLDALTWVLPHAGILVAGYRSRLEAAKGAADHGYIKFLGGTEFLAVQERALRVKLEAADDGDSRSWYGEAVAALSRCVALMPHVSMGDFTDRQPRRLVGLAKRALLGREKVLKRDGFGSILWRRQLLLELCEWHIENARTLAAGSVTSPSQTAKRNALLDVVAARTPWTSA